MSPDRSSLACAIYTRKSSEEGLEQGFNSLDAQREACEAFVLSQRHEGWKVIKECYDDGGYSGGTLGRPALKRLLDDIDKKRVQVVVVYKVDRLTRSLADFAKIVERFDAQGVSFVSVTQQFNTTSSMGRLTLNVLLSFAQFEREVTGERIRDKIAASKQKGMWMGGVPPIGYLGHERTLVIDENGIELIRPIYTRYLALGSVGELKRELDAQGIVTPKRVSKAGNAFGGTLFSRGQLYRVLTDPVYLGQIRHRAQVYPGQHPAILEQELWDEVQKMMLNNRQGHHRRQTTPSMSLLTGRLYDARGNRLVPSHSQKQSRRYRYYVSESLTKSRREQASEGVRVPAQELERVVIDTLRGWLSNPNVLLADLGQPEASSVQTIIARAKHFAETLTESGDARYHLIQTLVKQVMLGPEGVEITVRIGALIASPVLALPGLGEGKVLQTLQLSAPVQVRRCGLSMRLLIPGQGPARKQGADTRFIRALAKSHRWLELLTSGKVKGVGEIATAEGICNSNITRLIYRAFLAPDIVRAILDGTQPPALTAESLKQHIPLPIDWDEQRRLLGFR